MRSPLFRAAVAVLCLTLTAGAGAFAADRKPDAEKVPRPQLRTLRRPLVLAEDVKTKIFAGRQNPTEVDFEAVPLLQPLKVEIDFTLDERVPDQARLHLHLKVVRYREDGRRLIYQSGGGKALREENGRFRGQIEASKLRDPGDLHPAD
ncbi:hypothetical protein [Rubinisphaera margarita]|uniref:hypothetical protein n=1 Tax=Rubinisphaera margarita TaxID=2909586 RepID=UPI001EE8DA57|nr:hypothetical protein [Rubinisphaera margarita]MCG6155341.1 hypothetical protein [Rubinisphaera margarita]